MPPLRFTIADRTHDAGIRQLLRDTPMPGRDASMSLQCEPSYFDAVAMEGDEHHAIVALDGDTVVCAGGLSIRDRYYNGRVARVGYLGHLRLAPSHAGRADVLRRGYGLFRELCRSVPMDACFTSIASDNARAARLLGRGVRGLPRYTPAGELATLLIRRPARGEFHKPSASVRRTLGKGGLALRHGEPALRPAVAEASRAHGPPMQFAPTWSADDVDRACRSWGLADSHVRLVFRDGRPVGCAAVWDQRSVRQAVVNAYGPRLRRWRRAVNLWSGLTARGVPLPPPGRVVSQVFVSHCCLPPDDADLLVHLILSLSASAETIGVDGMTIGLDARDPRLPLLVRRFRPHVYRTQIYTVDWPDHPPAEPPDGRLLGPEVATL